MRRLKETIIQRKKNYIDISAYLKNDFTKDKNLKEFKVEQRSKLYVFARKVGKYLQKKGFHKLVAFVQENLNLDRYQFCYTMSDFMIYNDHKFISNAFTMILKRVPSQAEMEHYLSLLKSGKKSKTQIITHIRFTSEGKIKKQKIQGIRKRHLVFALYDIPVIGYIAKMVFTIVTLPKLIQRVNYLENNQIQNLNNQIENLTISYKNIQENLSPPRVSNHIEIDAINFLEDIREDSNKSNIKENELYYSLFEDAFYNHEVVLKKQSLYLKYIPSINSNKIPHLDIGCGRGEFLTLLGEHNFKALGIDINSLEIQKLKENDFDVEYADMIKFLKATTKTFSSISALQVIEHIDYETLKNFIALAYEKIVPSGALILETINPHNKVAFNSFYMDQTHTKPLPPEMVAFLLQFLGFKDIKYIYSSPMPTEFLSKTDKRINYHDYAVVGYKI